MTDKHSRPPLASTLATLAGSAMIFGSVLLTVAFPRLHMGIAITIGAALGSPLIAVGLRLHPNAATKHGDPQPFLPTRAELRRTLWGMVGVAAILLCLAAPLCLFGALFYLLPEGDAWQMVGVRITCVLLVVGATLWWFRYATRTFPERFRGRISDATLDAFTREEPAKEPASIREAVLSNWQLIAIAGTAFCVAGGMVDFDSPWLDLDVGPRRLRGIARAVVWCRGNPNTVASSAWIVGGAATILFATRIRHALLRIQSET